MSKSLSPLRYPGGKSQLSEKISKILESNNINNSIYIEPFAGGFGVGLYLLFNNKVQKVILNEYDIAIYSIWFAILYECEYFIKDIENTEVSIKEYKKQKEIYHKLKNNKNYSYKLAFAAFFLNRTNISGILNAGPIGGYEQNSKYKIDCRFGKENLIKKIKEINKYKDRIEIYNLNYKDFLKDIILDKYKKEDIFIFLDPPYYKQGKNLYNKFFNEKAHKELKENILNVKEYNWVMTYDNAKEIREIYKNFNTITFSMRYSANKVRKETELLIYSNKLNIKKDLFN